MIHGDRVLLRPITMNDLPYCVRWVSDLEVVRHVIQETKTEDEERQWLEAVLKDDQQQVFIIEVQASRKPIGTCAIHWSPTDPARSDEEGLSLGIMIGEKGEWGKGYGSEVVRLLANHTIKHTTSCAYG